MKTFVQFLEDTDMNVAPKGTKPPKNKDSDKDDAELVKGDGDKDDEIEDGSEDETAPKKDSKGKGTAANMIRNEAFKEVPTHLKSGKPNPNHPAFKSHEEKYKSDKAAEARMNAITRPPKPTINLDKIFYDLTGIISQFYPDGDPADYFPKYYRQHGINYEIARKAFKKNGYKDEYDYIDKMKDDLGLDEAVAVNKDLPPEGPAMTDMEKEQKAIYDAQTIQFKKDAKANSDLKATPMKESYSFKSYLKERAGREDDEGYERTKDADDTWNRKVAARKPVAPAKPVPPKQPIKNESVFDWKKNKSEVDWKSDEKKSADSTVHKGSYGTDDHVAPNDRKADGSVEKKNVGRPAGKYGNYKIDTAKREDPKSKEELSKKVMAAKAQGFKDRATFAHHLNTAIATKQLKDAGLNPADHQAALDKVVKKATGKIKPDLS